MLCEASLLRRYQEVDHGLFSPCSVQQVQQVLFVVVQFSPAPVQD